MTITLRHVEPHALWIIFSAATLFGVTEAYAAEERRCLPSAEMKANLNAKGQFSLVAFEQQGSDPSKFGFRAFYATKDGTLVTEVVGEEPKDPKVPAGMLQFPKELCFGGSFVDAKLAQNSDRKIPPSFLEEEVPVPDALTICKKRGWGDACGSYNAKLRGVAGNGRYPMLKFTAVGNNPDGTSYLGGSLTIIASLDGERKGSVELSANGVSKVKYDIRNTIYTKDGLVAMESGWPLVVSSGLGQK